MSMAFDELLGGFDVPDFDPRSEKAIQNDALFALWASCPGFWWRENTGQAWQGRKIRHDKDMLVLADARLVKFGLEGIADVMGHCKGFAFAIERNDSVGGDRLRRISSGLGRKTAESTSSLARLHKQLTVFLRQSGPGMGQEVLTLFQQKVDTHSGTDLLSLR